MEEIRPHPKHGTLDVDGVFEAKTMVKGTPRKKKKKKFKKKMLSPRKQNDTPRNGDKRIAQQRVMSAGLPSTSEVVHPSRHRGPVLKPLRREDLTSPRNGAPGTDVSAATTKLLPKLSNAKKPKSPKPMSPLSLAGSIDPALGTGSKHMRHWRSGSGSGNLDRFELGATSTTSFTPRRANASSIATPSS